MFKHFLNITSSTLVSSLTGWKGTAGSRKVELPEDDLMLFDRESCSECRSVRQVLTELNLDVIVYPCPEGGVRYKGLLDEVSGAEQLPFLYDKNTETKLTGAEAIVSYLYQQYANKAVPQKYQNSGQSVFESALESSIDWLRVGKGKHVRSSKEAKELLTLYSFESSPFSRPVRESLCELELAYKLINLGKQQSADMGPAAFRFHSGPYVPVKGSKREAFLAQHKDVMVPFIEDPNSGVDMFESKEILKYLDAEYAL
jgi:glutathione S-transferase